MDLIKAYIEAKKSTKKQIKGILHYPSNPHEFYDDENNIIAFKTVNLEKTRLLLKEIRKCIL